MEFYVAYKACWRRQLFCQLKFAPAGRHSPALLVGVSGVDALQSGLLLLEVLVEGVGPVTDRPDVQGEGLRLLGRRRDGERVPLKLSYAGDVEVDVVTRLEREVRWSLDDKADDPGGEHHPCSDVALALLRVGLVQADDLLHGKDGEGTDEPFPECGGVEDAQQPEEEVEEVGPVEYLGRVGEEGPGLTWGGFYIAGGQVLV